MRKDLIKIILMSYGAMSILLAIAYPLLSEVLFVYGPELLRSGDHFKIGVAATGFLSWFALVISGIASMISGFEMKWEYTGDK